MSGAEFGPTDRFGDIAAMPGSEDAMVTVVPFVDRHSTNAKATVALIGPDGTISTTRLPASGAGRGGAARIACPAPDECWLATWGGWLFHYSDGTPLSLDTDPGFQGGIDFRPNEAAEQFVPDTLPVDDSELFAPPPIEDAKAKEPRTRKLPPLLKRIRSRLHGLTLTVSFTITRRARVALIAKRGGHTVARTPKRTFGRGRHTLDLHLSRDRYPTKLAFETKELKR